MMNRRGVSLVTGLVALCVALVAAPVQAQGPMVPWDTPIIECVNSGTSQITLKITAGASGALAGFSVQWVTKAQLDANGGQWPSEEEGLCKLSLSGQPSAQHPGKSRWDLGPGESQTIIIGDINFDETGVSGNCDMVLECGTEYVFRAFAHAGRGFKRSAWTSNLVCSTEPCEEQCTLTQGFWKTHASVWPVTSMTLGTVGYTQTQLLAIFNKPAQGNGLIILAHQLIAAKLNLAAGVSNSCIAGDIVAADNLIGSKIVPPVGAGTLTPGSVGALVSKLDAFNNGALGPGCPTHCNRALIREIISGRYSPANTEKASWGEMKIRYR